MMILIGYVTDTSVSQLFLGGIIPGLLIGVGLMIVVYIHSSKGGEAYLQTREDLNIKRLFRTGISALPSLGLPFIIIFGIVANILKPL